MKRRSLALLLFVVTAFVLVGAGGGLAKPKPKKPKRLTPAAYLAKIRHVVVIYEENHSFDNLYGGWERVNGRTKATPAHTTQVNQNGTPYTCLMQLDVNLTAPPLTPDCTDSTTGTTFTSHFTNNPFVVDTFIPSSATTCPPPAEAFSHPNGIANGKGLPGGCTRDLVHEFYQEQYQLNDGNQNRYVTGSDAVGTSMGVYNTRLLPIYRFLHARNHPRYAIADNFFQSAFGGSFLNHQWLIAAATPRYPNPPATLRTILDANGMPVKYPLYTPTAPVRRGPITVACPSPVANRACGDFAVNTMQPTSEPFGLFGAKLIPQTHPTIGDRLTAKGVDWAWYSGGWSNAAGEVNGPGWTNGSGPTCTDPNADPAFKYPKCADRVFQYHHQPFVYFANYAVGAPGRAHLRDEAELLQQAQTTTAKSCKLKPVSFVKPLGEENEHPGYASTPNGEDHLVTLLRAVWRGACKKNTMVVVTYDEFGGQWDHVTPPGQGGKAGVHDEWGPGTRIPALLISPNLRSPFVVDHVQHDTTSILATIEHHWKVAPLSTRDAAVRDLSSVYAAK
jgi:acid phosphatase